MTPFRDEQGYRKGVPAFVDAYNRVRELITTTGLEPGDLIPGEVALSAELYVDRAVLQEALLLLEEDGKLVRDRGRRWRVARERSGALGFAEGFHHVLGDDVHPARRLHAGIEAVSAWSGELLGTDEKVLVWETVFEHEGVLLAATLELLVLSATPPELLEELDATRHVVAEQPTLLDALGAERRARLTPTLWRLAAVSRSTERLSWMELPLHGIPAAVTTVLAEDDRPVYLAKNIFDLATFDLEVDQRPAVADRPRG